MKSNNTAIIAAFHLLFVIALMILCRNAPLGDWGNYYYGSHLISHLPGLNFSMQPYNTIYFNEYVDAATHQTNFLSYAQVPPFSLIFYQLFTWMEPGISKIIFTTLTYLLCTVSVFSLFKKLKIDLRWSIFLPVLFLLAIKSNFEQGQAYFLLVALLGFGFLAREKGKWILSAFLFALAIHLKIFPAIILAWLLAEKDWKILGATIGAVVVLFAVTLPVIDWELWKYYGTEILPRLAKGEVTNTYATTYQSMQVLLKQLFVRDALHNPYAPADSMFSFRLLNLAWTGVMLTPALLFSFDKRQNSFTRFSVWLFAGMLISGYGSVYGLVLLIFPAIAIIGNENISFRRKIILLLLTGLICNLPVAKILSMPLPFSFLRLFLSLILFCMLIYFLRPRWNYAALAGFIVMPGLLTGNSQENGSRYFLKKEYSLLNSDMMLYGDTVIYYARTGEEKGQYREIFPEHIETAEEAGVNSNSVYWNGDVYRFPGEQISNLYIINNKYFLYLSDRNRGPGFYTIRIKPLDPEEHKKRLRELFEE